MKIPIVKEWGSWAVSGASCLAAVITGSLKRSSEPEQGFIFTTVLTILGLVMLINSKNPLAALLRSKDSKKEHVVWFLVFSMTGLVFLTPFIIDGIGKFAVFALLAFSYVIFLVNGKEHHILSELNGFALLTLSAPIVYFAITGEMSLKLYAVIFVYFAAGVFKVRVRIRKTTFHRCLMAIYCIAAVTIYYFLNVPIIVLLPLIENIWTVVMMREEKLKTTGYIELTKSVVFVILLSINWQ
jgi:hypothetical protein